MSDVTYNNGSEDTPAAIVKHHPGGNVDLLAAEKDSNDVKLFKNVPEGQGGNTYAKA